MKRKIAALEPTKFDDRLARMQRIQSLDGLRALSVGAVIVGHLMLPFTNGPIAHIGFIGVKMFFVISGFLITTLLIREGNVSLSRFYIRRALRILPLAYGFILVIAILWRLGIVESSGKDLLMASTYTMSYWHPSFETAHLWSLSVEEQFYLLWPLAFVVAAGKRAKAVALGVVLAGPLLRTAWWFLLPQQRSLIDIAFPNVADTIAIGCYAAFNTEWCSRMAKKMPSWFVIACPLVAWGIWQSPPYLPEGLLRKIYVPFVDSLLNLFLVLFLIGTVYNDGRIARLLNARMLVFIGTISYSLYIWQQLFVQQASPSALGTIARLAAIFTVAISAHYAIEKPFLRLKDRFAVKAVAAAA